MGLKVLHDSHFFSKAEIRKIEDAIEFTNDHLVTPYAKTGELIIFHRRAGDMVFTKTYHATLEDGPGGSCAASKIGTLITHPKYRATGQIPASDLAEGEVRLYGGDRIFATIILDFEDENPTERYEFLIAFSDRIAWQDELYVAAVTGVMESFPRIMIQEDNLCDDPIIGTARNIMSETWIAYE